MTLSAARAVAVSSGRSCTRLLPAAVAPALLREKGRGGPISSTSLVFAGRMPPWFGIRSWENTSVPEEQCAAIMASDSLAENDFWPGVSSGDGTNEEPEDEAES
jgi:hypothetical protein